MQLERVAPGFAGRRVVIAAPGPSLTAEVADLCRDEIVIAVNDAWRLLPWAKMLYACDGSWWQFHDGCPEFQGEKWTSHGLRPMNDKREIADRYGLRIVRGELKPGFSRDAAVLHYGHNGGFQAVNLALLMGGNPLVLVGFDMRPVEGRSHFFGEHPRPLRHTTSYQPFIRHFETAARDLPKGLQILNATPASALKCFPFVDLAELLGRKAAA